MEALMKKKAHLGSTTKIDFNKQLDYSNVKDKTAVVQDAASGLGLGIAEALAENGAKVAIFDPKEEAGEAAVKDLQSKGYQAKFFKTDTSNWEAQLASYKAVLAWSEDQLDIVVTSPGIVTNNLLLSILPKHQKPDADPPKPSTAVFEVDLLGVYYATQLALFYFNRLDSKRQDRSFRPQILFICSMAGYDGLDFGTDYAASKHGVRAIFKTTRKPRPGMARYQANMLTPTYTRATNISRSEDEMKNHHHQRNEITDVVAGAMRCICDDEVEGRSVACVQGSTGTPGNLNFDMCDDLVGHNGGRELLERVDDVWLPSSAALSEDSNCAVQ